MKDSMLAVTMVCLWTATSHAETGFDQRYERDYNIFNPVTQYQPDNPLNPANAYAPDNPFNPVNRYDPGNPLNPVNKYSPSNPFNPVNRYHPDNPLNPVNKYNPAVPFGPLEGGAEDRNMVMREPSWSNGSTAGAGCPEDIVQFAVKPKLVRPIPEVVKVEMQARVLDDADHIIKVSWSARS